MSKLVRFRPDDILQSQYDRSGVVDLLKTSMTAVRGLATYMTVTLGGCAVSLEQQIATDHVQVEQHDGVDRLILFFRSDSPLVAPKGGGAPTADVRICDSSPPISVGSSLDHDEPDRIRSPTPDGAYIYKARLFIKVDSRFHPESNFDLRVRPVDICYHLSLSSELLQRESNEVRIPAAQIAAALADAAPER